MKENLVIVESPAKAKTIEKFLGDDYKVMSSYGHIRDLAKHTLGIEKGIGSPQYEIPDDKVRVVSDLRRAAKSAKMVWLASDEDREGEAISWHLKEVLGLSTEQTRRIVFHEITKPAILEAIKHPRTIDQNLVNAQQARRVLDRVVGFRLSPVLWRKVKPSLSAGRVQSVAVRLIVEREREIMRFEGERYFRVTALLADAEGREIKAELTQRFASEEEAAAFLEACKGAQMTVSDVQQKPMKRTPAAPFTTSTLQQEAAHKLRFTVAQTMNVAQRLYESGRITYMRTDSTNLSQLALGAAKQYVSQEMGSKYVKTRQYQTKQKGAQEAHEAIRPTYLNSPTIEGTAQERRLYELIWQRTIASQMAEAIIEKTTINIRIGDTPYTFVATGEVVKFDGFLRVYMETPDEDASAAPAAGVLPAVSQGQALLCREISAQQKASQHPPRYNEPALVRKLEELGIGRPSTYATTITTIQQRQYVQKGDKEGQKQPFTTLTLKGEKVKRSEKQQTVGAEKGKLLPTDTGSVVTDFLIESFPSIMDYNFTAEVEKNFDQIAEGQLDWTRMLSEFLGDFMPTVDEAMDARTERRVGERLLGTAPKSGLQVSARIGKYGPVVQIGTAQDSQKPRFANLGPKQSIETITLEEALDLFRLPRTLGQRDGADVVVNSGRFGPYVMINKTYASLPKGTDLLSITLEEALEIYDAKQQAEASKHIKRFEEEPELEVVNGRFGPYLVYRGANYRLTKEQKARAAELTADECLEAIKAQRK